MRSEAYEDWLHAWELLREEKVAVMPGTSFGDQAAGFLRISLTMPEDVIATAMERIASLAGRIASTSKDRATTPLA